LAIIFIRTFILFFALLIAMRAMGKRQLGELEPSELVVAVLISDIAAHPLQDISTPMINALIPIITLPCLEILITALTLKNLRFRSFICGRPSILIENGQINEREMRRNRVSLDELAEELRHKDITDISKVHYAILETDGQVSALLYSDEKPPSAKNLSIHSENSALPVVIINDGRLLSENLRFLGKNEQWLQQQLRKNGVSKVADVFYFTCDAAGNTYFSARRQGKKS